MLTTVQALTDIDCIRHGFFTRQGGVSAGAYASLNCGWSSGDDINNVAENRRRIAAAMQTAPERLLTCYQIHSANVISATEPWTPADRPQADAMVTDRPGLALGILTADCVPILFVDPAARVIGAAHAGWRGTLDGIVEATVTAMRKLGAQPGAIVAAIGPCIWQQSYEVGPEFAAPFLALDPGNARYFIPAPRAGHAMFDLPGLVMAKLRQAGIGRSIPSPANTFADDTQYFSYRRNTLQGINGTGSLMSAIVMKSA